jgi:hypothetical protein
VDVMSKKLMVSLMALGLAAMLGAGGCKNACEKAAAKWKECCEGNTENIMCRAMNEGTDPDAAEAGECGDTEKAQAEALLALSCEQLLGGNP